MLPGVVTPTHSAPLVYLLYYQFHLLPLGTEYSIFYAVNFLGKFGVEMERLLPQKSLGTERANSIAREREMYRQASSQKSMERVISHKALQTGGALFHCKALWVGFLCGAGVTYLLLLAVGTSFKGTPTLFTFDVVSMHSLRQSISAGPLKDHSENNQTLQKAQASGTSFGILHFLCFSRILTIMLFGQRAMPIPAIF